MIINLAFDTTTKKLTVTADGKSLDNVRDVTFYGYAKDKFDMAIVQRSVDESQGVVTYTQTVAGEQAYAELGEPAGAEVSAAALLSGLFKKKGE